MGLFNLKLEAITTGKAAPPKSRNVQHFHVQVPRTHPIPETCSMGVSESRVLGAAAALHDIQQEAKTGQHALEKLNVFSSFTQPRMEVLLTPLWKELVCNFLADSLGSEICMSRLCETTRGDQFKILHAADSLFYKDLASRLIKPFFEEAYAASVASCLLNMMEKLRQHSGTQG